MRVTVWKTVEVECECDVAIEDVLAEFARRADEAKADYWRRLTPALDWMTRILAAIPDDVVAAIAEPGRTTLRERLAAQAARYEEKHP